MKIFIFCVASLLIALFPALAVSPPENRHADVPVMAFIEDLRIGENCKDEHCLWAGAKINVAVDDQGQIFVTDSGANRVVVFDAKGRYHKSFGGFGQGPGEFQQLYQFQILADQKGVAFDNNGTVVSFTYFDADQKYLEKVTFQPNDKFVQSATLSPNGERVAAMFIDLSADANSAAGAFSGILDKKLEPLLILSKHRKISFDQNRMMDAAWWRDFLAAWMKEVHQGVGTMGFSSNGFLYAAITTENGVTQYDPDLKFVRAFHKDNRPELMTQDQLEAFIDPVHEEILGTLPPPLREVVTKEVVRQAIDAAAFPSRKQPIFALLPVEDRGVLVVKDHNPLTKKTEADFFSFEGVYLGEVDLPPIDVNLFGGFFGNPTRLLFHKGFAYAVLTSDEGDRHVVRYRYRLNL